MNGFIKAAEKFQREDRGASMAEYALLLVLVAVICLAAIASFGTAINNFFGSLASTI